MQYLDAILKKVHTDTPTQLILYYFDIINVRFIKEKIIEKVQNETSKDIQISAVDIVDIMVEQYHNELVHNKIVNLEDTISKLNSRVIAYGIETSKSQIRIDKYRQGIYTPRYCEYPKCSNA